jgi:hypothetical protein
MAAFDLAALWDAHCRYEFDTRDVDVTMSTMVTEPYVNHIPTMTGGVGFESLRDFYAHHFIVAHLTHTTRMDWMLPGIEPTGRIVEIPMVAIVRFQDDNSCTSTFTGTKPACSFNSVCSIPRAFPSPGRRPHAKCSTFPCPATP